MTLNSTIMIHQCTWGGIGTNAQMQDRARSADAIMRKMRKIYMDETLLGAQYSDPKQRVAYLESLLEHDTYLDYNECEKYGFLQNVNCEEELTEENQETIEKMVVEMLKKQKQEKEEKKKNFGKEPASTPKKTTKKEPEKKEPTKKTPSKTKSQG